jgi:hypothetical protein
MQVTGSAALSATDFSTADRKRRSAPIESFDALLATEPAGIESAAGDTQSGEIDLAAETDSTTETRLPRKLLSDELPKTLNQMRVQYERNLSEVEHALRALWKANDIQTSPPLNLVVAGEGRVIVAGDHPQKAQVEQLLADNPALGDKMATTAAQGATLHAFERSIKFQKEYARDPIAAVEKFSDLFDGRDSQFSLTIAGDLFLPMLA